MAASLKWTGVSVAIGTLGSAVTVNAISKASPGLLEYTGTDPSDGDYVALTDVLGMHQVNNRIFRVDNEDTVGDDFDLEGEDTTLYDTFASGNFQVISFSTTMTTARGITASGGDFDFADETTIHDLVRSQSPNQANPLTYSFDCKWDPSDTSLRALFAATQTQSLRALRMTWPNGYKFLLLGYVATALAPTGSAGEVVTTPVVFSAYGRPTTYLT